MYDREPRIRSVATRTVLAVGFTSLAVTGCGGLKQVAQQGAQHADNPAAWGMADEALDAGNFAARQSDTLGQTTINTGTQVFRSADSVVYQKTEDGVLYKKHTSHTPGAADDQEGLVADEIQWIECTVDVLEQAPGAYQDIVEGRHVWERTEDEWILAVAEANREGADICKTVLTALPG